MDEWLRWQVPVCAMVFLLPAVIAVKIIVKRAPIQQNSTDFWAPCWRNLNPLWLLLYRAVAFASMAFLLYQIVATFGFFVFFFYTQWTFALVVLYFALGTIVSARGCWTSSSHNPSQISDNFLKRNLEDTEHETSRNKQQAHHYPVHIGDRAGFLENLMIILYQTCGGAVMLTDIVFWCLLLPFMTGENFQLTLLIGCMHSVNAVFLLGDSALNRLPFPWYSLAYFVLWSCTYIVFQWTLHACCLSWWPYPFLELSTPWAPLWYLGLALVHIPCYGLYMLLIKAKDATFSRMSPHTYIRVSTEMKQA